MHRSLLALTVLLSINLAHADVTCGGVSSEVFRDVDLQLEELYDSEFLEEGLSFHEYPYFWISSGEEFYDVSIGAGAFDMKLSCLDGAFILTDAESYTLIRNIKVEAGKVTSAEVFTTESKDSKVALFTTKGKEVVYGDLDYFVAKGPHHILSSFLNDDSSLMIDVGVYGEYIVEIGSLKIDTGLGNPDGNFALYNALEKVLYLEVPKYNLVIELEITSSSSEIERVKVRAGMIDSIAKLQDVGEFMGYLDFNSL